MNIIVGRQGSGKSTVVYRQIKQCLDRGEDNLILIVPEQFTLQAERELIEELKGPGIINVEILSFSRLANRIMSEIGGLAKTKLSNTGKYMALQKSLLENKEGLSIYSGMTKKPGFVQQLHDLVGNLKRRMITTDDLNSLLEEDFTQNPILYRKMKDINLILKNYNGYLGEEYLDSEGVVNYIVENIYKSKLIADSKIWIDGFHTFTEQIFQLIEKVNLYAKELTVSITQRVDDSSRDGEIFEISKKTQKRLISIGQGKYRIISCHFQQKGKPLELMHLQKEIYSLPSEKFEAEVKHIAIRSYKDIYSELEGLSIEILNLVQEKGYRWRDIYVVNNDFDNYSFIIKRVFEEFDIPFFMDSKRKISDKPLSILLVNTLKSIISNFRYEDIFALIKTGLTDLEYEEYELLENYVLEYGIKGKGWKEEFSYVSEKSDFDLEALDLMRKKVIDPILMLKEEVSKEKTFKNITLALFNYIKTLRVDEKLHQVIDEIKEDPSQQEYASEISQIYNTIINLFDEMVEIFGDSRTTTNEYLQILQAGIESIDLAIIPSSLDKLTIGDITRSRNSDYKVLFVLGVNEGKLPSTPSLIGLLNEKENEVVKDKGLEIEDDFTFKSIQEKYLFYNVLSKTKEKVFISYPLADYEGNPMTPSVLINQFLEIFVQLKVAKDSGQSLAMTNSKGSFKYLIDHYRKVADGYEKAEDSKWDHAYLWYKKDEFYGKKLADMKDAMMFDNQVKNLQGDLVHKLYGDQLRTSVTRLEEYANCPFKHFVTYGLKPKERKIYQISIPDLGEILHSLIYDFSLRVESENLDWNSLEKEDTNRIGEMVMCNFTLSYRHGIFNSSGRYKYLRNYIFRVFCRAIEMLVYQHKKGKFTILGNELIFGLGKALPPITIELSKKKLLYLEGRIDRVDIFQKDSKTYLKILDFKTGSKEFLLSDVYFGLSLQLMVYTWVCLNYGQQKGIETIPAGMFYFKIQDPMVLSGEDQEDRVEREIKKRLKLNGLLLKDKMVLQALDEDIEDSDILSVKVKKNGDFSSPSKGLVESQQIGHLISHVEKVISSMADEIFDGNISINPVKKQDKVPCTYCQYQSICFFDQSLAGSKYSLKPELNDQEVLSRIEAE